MFPICRGGQGAWGSGAGKLWLMYFQRASRSSAIRGECRELDRGGGSGGSPERGGHGPSVHHFKGAQPKGFSGQSLYFDESNLQHFGSVQMYLEG